MTCPDCSTKMSIKKTAHFARSTLRIEECLCGSRFETETKVIRRLPATANSQPATVGNRRYAENRQPATAGTPPATTGGVGGDLSSDQNSIRIPDPNPVVVDPPDRARESAPPFRPARRAIPIALKTLPFLAVYRAYPRKDKQMEAAAVWCEIASEHPGGEAALRDAILAWFATGVLTRHPYAGENKYRPMLESVLAERRWEDDVSAPDDVTGDDAPSRRKPKELEYA
jgi:hypothetical protein